MTPSIPLAPRFECTVISLRGVPNHSTSRTGIDDATTRWPPAGMPAVIARAMPGSERLPSPASALSSTSRAILSAASHRSIQAGSRGWVSSAARREHSAPIEAWTCRAPTRFGSETRPTGDTATCFALDPASHCANTFDAGGIPNCSTTAGRWARGKLGVSQERIEPHYGRLQHLTPRKRIGHDRPSCCRCKFLHRARVVDAVSSNDQPA